MPVLRLRYVCLGVFLLTVPGPGSLQAAPAEKAWSRNLGGEEFLFTADSLLLLEDRILAAGVRRDAGDLLSPATPAIFSLSREGEPTGEIVFEGVEVALSFLDPGVPALVELGDGAVVGAVQETPREARLFALSEDGAVSWGAVLPGAVRTMVTRGDELLVFGDRDGSVFLARVDAQLEVSGPPSTLIAEASVVEVGALPQAPPVVVTRSLLDGEVGIGVYDLLLSAEDQEARPLYRADGTGGSIATRPGGGFLLVHDTEVEGQRAIRLVAFDDQGQVEWTEDVALVRPGLARSRIVAAADGRYALVSSEGNRVRVSVLDASGEEAWVLVDGDVPRWSMAGKDLAVEGDELYVLTDVISNDEQRQINNKMGVWRFELE